MKRLLVCTCILAAPLFLAACGYDDSGETPVVAEQADAAPSTPLPPPSEESNGSPPGRTITLPCDRAVCNDLDQRDWRVNPPPDDYVPVAEEEYVPVAEVSPDDPADIRIRFIRVRVRAAAGR